ncbi:secreted protein [Rhodopirellula maiorica SM1]|uniref:Secreted protein n=1 Tax=Rhodopirellula maiorica SM1 TaxID=1265738 RepID=M5RS77_9BACT|nr:secreted protein [Rhodopirellula maiorica]EMI22071.1 secreted protein [Rhodopirellula maiorica SM1]
MKYPVFTLGLVFVAVSVNSSLGEDYVFEGRGILNPKDQVHASNEGYWQVLYSPFGANTSRLYECKLIDTLCDYPVPGFGRIVIEEEYGPKVDGKPIRFAIFRDYIYRLEYSNIIGEYNAQLFAVGRLQGAFPTRNVPASTVQVVSAAVDDDDFSTIDVLGDWERHAEEGYSDYWDFSGSRFEQKLEIKPTPQPDSSASRQKKEEQKREFHEWIEKNRKAREKQTQEEMRRSIRSAAEKKTELERKKRERQIREANQNKAAREKALRKMREEFERKERQKRAFLAKESALRNFLNKTRYSLDASSRAKSKELHVAEAKRLVQSKDYDANGSTTRCNQFLAQLSSVVLARKPSELFDSNGNPHTANAQFMNLVAASDPARRGSKGPFSVFDLMSTNEFQAITIEKNPKRRYGTLFRVIQRMSDQGLFVVAASYNADGHGHVATIAPHLPFMESGKYGGAVPMVIQAGRTTGVGIKFSDSFSASKVKWDRIMSNDITALRALNPGFFVYLK